MRSVVDGLRVVGGLLLPMFAAARDVRRFRPIVRWLLHAVLLFAVLALVYVVHVVLDLDRFVRSPDWVPYQTFRNLWLPLIFLLLYVLCWIARWLWDLLSPEQESSVFPDLDQSWQEAVHALDRAGIDLTAAPLFLVMGRPRGSEVPLLLGVQPRLLVNQIPSRPDAPLHVYANREGVYVTCPGASLMGRQAALMAQEPAEHASAGGESAVEMFETLKIGAQGSTQAIEQIIARARSQGRNAENLFDEERRAIGLLIASANQSGAPEEGRSQQISLLQNRAEVESCTQRLQYLCRLIARDRLPFSPINGILLVFPIAATGGDDFATQVGLVAQRDLATLRRTLRVNCPVFALFCDLETLPGFHALTDRLGMSLRDRRMGQRFPLVPDAQPSAIPAMLESGVQHIGNRLIPNLVSTLWQTETMGGGSYAESVRGNSELFRFLGSVRDRQARIARVLTRAVISEGAPPAMLGGCYLAGTGPDPLRDQAFIPGVFRRLLEGQDFVAWTPAALAEEQKYQLWTRIGYAAIGLITIACAVIAAFRLFWA